MALQPPTDRPVKRTSGAKRGKQPPTDPPIKRASQPRIFKGSDGKVNTENIKGRSSGRGPLRDQRAKNITSRPLGGSRKTRGEVR
jgi:hypothetical protein